MKHLILVDGNNIGFSAMNSPRLSAGGKDTNSIFNTIRTIRKFYLDNPDALIVVLWDGYSWRKAIYREYKANREKTEKQQSDRAEYYEQKKGITRALTLLGVTQCQASNMEADDLAAILVDRFEDFKVDLVTADRDWIQLVNERVTWVDPIHERFCKPHNLEEVSGAKNVSQFLEIKAVLGDAGDNIKGVPGIGPKTLENIYKCSNSLTEFLLMKDFEDIYFRTIGKKAPKALREANLKDVMAKLNFNNILMHLRNPLRPEMKNFTRTVQPIDEEGFKDFCYEHAFLSFMKDYDKFLAPFRNNKYAIREV